MKKLAIFLAAVLTLAGCSKENIPVIDENPKEEQINIIGVWRCGSAVVSFNTDGYYSASLTNKHIDTGSYSLNGKDVTCYNNYNNKYTYYQITSIDSKSLTCTITFSEYKGEEQTAKMTFEKTEEKPSAREHFLIGKSWSYLSSNYGRVFEEFRTHNIAYKYSENDPTRYKTEWYYFFINPHVYLQEFTPKDGVQRPSSSWHKNADSGEVIIMKALISGDHFGGVSKE